MLQDTQFRIHHTLDAKGVQLLGACRPYASVRPRIGRLVKLQCEFVHVLELIGTDNVTVDFILAVHQEYAGEDIIADDFRKFLQGIDGQSIVIHITVNGQTIGYALDAVVVQLDFATPRHILRIPSSGLQSVQLHHGRISVLVITALIHIALGQVHLGNHDVRQDPGIGEGLARLRNHVDNGTRTGAATQAGKDMDGLHIGIAGYQLATGIGIAQAVDIADGVRREEQTARTAFLSGSLPQRTDGRLDGRHIIHNALHRRIVIDMIQDMLHIHGLDIQEFIVGERCVLPHHAEIRACPSVLGHHLVRRIHVQQGYGQLGPLFLRGKLLEHTHFEGAQDFTACTSQPNQDMVAVAKICLCHDVVI